MQVSSDNQDKPVFPKIAIKDIPAASYDLPGECWVSFLPSVDDEQDDWVIAEVSFAPAHALLLHDLSQQIERFVLLPDPSLYQFVALWILGTHLYTEFQHYGFLSIESPTHGCGKTTLLEVIDLLVHKSSKPMVAPTPAVLFHTAKDGTQLLDEVDTWSAELKQSLTSILNAGFSAGGVVKRMAKDQLGNFEHAREYPVYCPKALAGIGTILRGANRNRAFTVKLQKQSRYEKRERFTRSKRAELAELKQRIETWAAENHQSIRNRYEVDEFSHLLGFEDRTYDIACSLASILEVMELGHEALADFLNALSMVREETSEALQDWRVLTALLSLATDGQPVQGTAIELADGIRSSVPEITDGAISTTLRRYGFDTKSVRLGGDPKKRYSLDPAKLSELLSRYSPFVVGNQVN